MYLPAETTYLFYSGLINVVDHERDNFRLGRMLTYIKVDFTPRSFKRIALATYASVVAMKAIEGMISHYYLAASRLCFKLDKATVCIKLKE